MFEEYLTLLRMYSEKTQKQAATESNMKLSKYKSLEKGSNIPEKECCKLLSKMLGFDFDVFNKDKPSVFNLSYVLESCKDDTYIIDVESKNSVFKEDYLTEEEIRLVGYYRKLDSCDKEKVYEIIKKLSKFEEL